MADQLASEHNGLTLRWTAGSRSLSDAIEHGAPELVTALSGRLSRRGRTVDATLNVGVPGAGASATTRQVEPPTRSTFATLQQLGRLAEKKNHTILFWIDEAQRATADEVAVLAGCMQEIANVQRLPITICAAGLPDTRPNWINGASSLERQEFTTIGNLAEDDTAAAIEIPIRETGRTIMPDALDLLVVATKGFPYAIQLMAANTWNEARDQATITREHAAPAIANGIQQLREQLYESRYRQMPASIRDYLHAAAAIHAEQGSIRSSDVAERLGLTTKHASTRRDELISNYQVLSAPRRNELEFTTPGFAEWIQEQRRQPTTTTITADDTIDQFLAQESSEGDRSDPTR